MITTDDIQNFDISEHQKKQLINLFQDKSLAPPELWQRLLNIIFEPRVPFTVFKYLYAHTYPEDSYQNPAWIPSQTIIEKANITQTLQELNLKDYDSFHQWSVTHFQDYWKYVINKLKIIFKTPYTRICDLSLGIELPQWLMNAKLNIADSCFLAAPEKIAIVYQPESGAIETITYAALNALSNRVANGVQRNFNVGDALAIDMVMDINAVAIYLGIIKAGCTVVSIADSFAADEIASRLRIADVKGIFTQDYLQRSNKKIPLYRKVIEATAPKAIVITHEETTLRDGDLYWKDFLSDNVDFVSISCQPDAATNILFSSGTTGDPKAIPWTHTTPIKAAADAYFHHDVHADDIFAWPTNLGWMMGPWLIYAGLLNQATIALYGGAPTTIAFAKFIEKTKTTILGLVPSIVSAWRSSGGLETCDWRAIRVFSSSGECSNPEDMLYLMWLANNKPIIEYCGGTEIGGAYITGTIVQAAIPATFTTATLGVDFIMIDEYGKPTENGEVALIPPSIGLSTTLINRDHHEIYFAGMPEYKGKPLRRHGDQIEKIAGNYFRALGRVDDTMNLGAIKISSAEIERVLNVLEDIKETAAISVSPQNGGPSLLVIYVVLNDSRHRDAQELKTIFQTAINQQLNPLFKIHDVVIVNDLPRTASNKIMRRNLRSLYNK